MVAVIEPRSLRGIGAVIKPEVVAKERPPSVVNAGQAPLIDRHLLGRNIVLTVVDRLTQIGHAKTRLAETYSECRVPVGLQLARGTKQYQGRSACRWWLKMRTTNSQFGERIRDGEF